jgi:hypothetical protein
MEKVKVSITTSDGTVKEFECDAVAIIGVTDEGEKDEGHVMNMQHVIAGRMDPHIASAIIKGLSDMPQDIIKSFDDDRAKSFIMMELLKGTLDKLEKRDEPVKHGGLLDELFR